MGAEASKLQQDQRLWEQPGPPPPASARRPVLQHSVSLDLPPSSASASQPVPAGPRKGKGKNTDYHFSDFCLYPDRFTAPRAPKPSPAEGEPPADLATMTMSRSVQEGGFERATGGAAASNPVSISDKVGHFGSAAAEQKADFERFLRRRANSQGNAFSAAPSRDGSPKLLYFDFSLIPEKDPKAFQGDSSEHLAPPKEVRQRLLSMGDEPMSLPIQLGHDCREVADAAKTPNQEPEHTLEAQRLRVKSAPRTRNASEPPKFSFFDYSLIPDKMNQDLQVSKGK